MIYLLSSSSQLDTSIDIVYKQISEHIELEEYRNLHAYCVDYEADYTILKEQLNNSNTFLFSLESLFDILIFELEIALTKENKSNIINQLSSSLILIPTTEYVHRLELQLVEEGNVAYRRVLTELTLDQREKEETVEQLIAAAPNLEDFLENIALSTNSNGQIQWIDRDTLNPDYCDLPKQANVPIQASWATLSDGEGSHHLALGFATMYIFSNDNSVAIDISKMPMFRVELGNQQLVFRVIEHNVNQFTALSNEATEKDSELFYDRFSDSGMESFQSPIDEDTVIKNFVIERELNFLPLLVKEQYPIDYMHFNFDLGIDKKEKTVNFYCQESCYGIADFDLIYLERIAAFKSEIAIYFEESPKYSNYQFIVNYHEIECEVLQLNNKDSILVHVGILGLDEDKYTNKRWTFDELAQLFVEHGVFSGSISEQIASYDGNMWTNSFALYDRSGDLLFLLEAVFTDGYSDNYTSLKRTFDENFKGGCNLIKVGEFGLEYQINEFSCCIKAERFRPQTIAQHLLILAVIEDLDLDTLYSTKLPDQSVVPYLTLKNHYPYNFMLAGPVLLTINDIELVKLSLEELEIDKPDNIKINQLAPLIRKKSFSNTFLNNTSPPLVFFPLITDMPMTETTDFVIGINMTRGGIGEEPRGIEDFIPQDAIDKLSNSIGGRIKNLSIIHPDYIQ
ncbi:hypothetical protein UA32_12510 [Photobacterium angustum]|uniref:Uncharacterized protein n=2 Tax=Photobacterium angustum TaxID=661 RepID=A0ABX5H1N9_PHOAN|nr:hypothetical protein UA32_12510 [Photobacterium angustum]PSX07036.1 hypothetical protein C0W27_15825 [Photobacterium angustum]